jgi:hypothetical protein
MSSSQLDAFAEQARRFCRWASGEDGAAISAASALRRVSSLYSAALELPLPFTKGMSAELAEVDPRSETVEQVAARVASSKPQVHWEILDPLHDPPEEPLAGSIADDIGDIYRDVARGLVLFESGKRAEALWQWGFNFRIHWGAHATGAMRALHAYLAHEDPDGLSQETR